jgi:hypothetical protein
LWKIAALTLGCLLFFTGGALSRLSLLHYSLGSVMAVVLFAMLVVRRPGAVGLPAVTGVFAVYLARQGNSTKYGSLSPACLLTGLID